MLQVASGQTTDASVVVENVQGLYGVDVSLTFDPTAVEVLDSNPNLDGVQVGFGKFLDSGFVLLNRVDNELGQVRFAMTQLYPSQAKNGSGILVVLKLRGKQVGATSALTISEAVLAGQGGNELVPAISSGSVAVLAQVSGPTNTPIPTQGAGTPMPTGTFEPTQNSPAVVEDVTSTPTSTSPPPTSQPTATRIPTHAAAPTSTSVPKVAGGQAPAVSAEQQPQAASAAATQPAESAPATALPQEATATLLATPTQAEVSPTMTAAPIEGVAQTTEEPSPDLAVQSGLPQKSAAKSEPSLGVASSVDESKTVSAWNGWLIGIPLVAGAGLLGLGTLLGVFVWVRSRGRKAR